MRGELSIVKSAATAGALFMLFQPLQTTGGMDHDAFALR